MDKSISPLFQKKALVLSQLILNTAKLYQDADESEKSFLEMMVGMGIRDLSKNHDLRPEKISLAALGNLRTGIFMTNRLDQQTIPRRIVAMLFYTVYLDDLKQNPNALADIYLNEFDVCDLILRSETTQLRRLLRMPLFTSMQDAYQQAGIEMVDMNEEDILLYMRQNKRPFPERKHDIVENS
jgi:hypothetical protein